MKTPPLRIGTRGSRLALAQAEWVARRLVELHPGLECRIVIIQTTGDRLLGASLAQIAGTGVFAKEIERALAEGQIDLAVHSLKDLPTAMPEGLRLGAISPREDPADAVVAARPLDWKDGEAGLRLATSSLRRRAQLWHGNPRLRIEEIRGNVPTRIEKALRGEIDGVVLALAGLRRLGSRPPWTRRIDFADMLPAPGQGALALQVREDDRRTLELLRLLNDKASEAACRAERAFLAALGGGCRAPIAALGQAEGAKLFLEGMVASPDGNQLFRDAVEGGIDDPEELGRRLAETLARQGAAELIEELALASSEQEEPTPPPASDIGSGPLTGRQVVVTRDEDSDGPLSRALRELGAEPLVLPLIAQTGAADSGPLQRAAARTDEYDWIAFSSARAVSAFAGALKEAGKGLASLPCKTACVGPKTAEALTKAGGRADRVAEKPGAKGLLELLRKEQGLSGARVLYPRAEGAAPTLGDGLRALGCQVDEPVAYGTERRKPSGPTLDLLRRGECDAVALASPSAAEALAEALGREEAAALSGRIAFAAVGPTTSAAMRRLGMAVAVEAEERTFEGLAQALARHFARQ